MVSRAILLVALACAIVGCKDENSPDMGAVPPKPNPDMLSKMPPELRQRAQGAKEGMAAQANEMGQMAKNARGSAK